jgi:hypothetical protein
MRIKVMMVLSVEVTTVMAIVVAMVKVTAYELRI